MGSKKKWDRNEIKERLRNTPIYQQRTYRSMSSAINVPKSTLHSMKTNENNIIIPHSNSIKPILTAQNRMQRLRYAVEHTFEIDGEVYYDDFYDTVFLDEKWFFISEKELLMYLTEGEEPPDRFCKHKSHILKVMFLCAVARPRFDEEGNEIFDGKIGIWPFVEEVTAVRNSKNREAGEIELKNVPVTKELYVQYVCEKVVPKIKEKFLAIDPRKKDIKVQHDNAKTHHHEQDPDWAAVSKAGNWNMTLAAQPPNSPDKNILDLGFFRALQSNQWNHGFASNTAELIAQVERAFLVYPSKKLACTFVTLQSVLDETLKNNGRNNYKIPHMNKAKMMKEGTLPLSLKMSDDARVAFDNLWEQEEGWI